MADREVVVDTASMQRGESQSPGAANRVPGRRFSSAPLEELQAELRSCGGRFPIEGRPFSPEVTLGLRISSIMKAPTPDRRGPSTNSPPTEAKPSGRRHQDRPAKEKRKKDNNKKGPPQHWKYVSYADIRQIIAKTKGVPKEAVEALTAAFFLSAPRPSKLGELWRHCKSAMIELAEWISIEGGPYLMNHIAKFERVFTEPAINAQLIPDSALVHYEPGVVGEASHAPADVDRLRTTSGDSAELAIAAYREVEKWAGRHSLWQGRVVSLPTPGEGAGGPQKLLVWEDSRSPWKDPEDRHGWHRLRRRPKPSRAPRPDLISHGKGVGVFMYWGMRVLVESDCRSGKPSERVSTNSSRPETEDEFAITVLNQLAALLYAPPQERDTGEDDRPSPRESQEGDAEMDSTSTLEACNLRDIATVSRQASGRGDEPGTGLKTMREPLEALASLFKNRYWWIPDHRRTAHPCNTGRRVQVRFIR